MLCNDWKPGSDFSFPPHENIGRRFRFAWLSRFLWLANSAVANGGFCVTCVLFRGESTHNASKLPRLRMTSALPPSASAVQHVSMVKNPMFTQRQLSVLHSLSE